MNRTTFFVVVIATALLLAGSGLAQTYTLATQILSNGATNSSNASYSLQGTLYQSAIRLTKASGNQVQQGFWRYMLTYYPCCIGIRGNVNNDEQQMVDLTDLTFLSSYLTSGSPVPACYDEGNVNGIGIIDLADLTYLSSYLSGGNPPPSCP
ncbi:hypothetical protein C3F09_01180 [candidate division GN15 bacterium]|uniref:Dockerin domain-containing protein n=1 Tax=candidate division GN15 bacterium TaxID=2072418 RepID=A0A855XD79_9BACT|nr:MAG: hypothetical protein C3F09_01180 [candidate division GN15 bacterium]